MSAAEQAFLLTGELFVLSFVAIYAFWFADKLRRNFSGKALASVRSPDGAERNPEFSQPANCPGFRCAPSGLPEDG